MIGRHGLGVIVSEKGVSYGGKTPLFFAFKGCNLKSL